MANSGMGDATMPSPPYPDPDNPRLGLTLYEAEAMLRAGTEVREVVLWSVVHGWMEGYIDAAGEDLRGGRGPLSDEEAQELLRRVREGN